MDLAFIGRNLSLLFVFLLLSSCTPPQDFIKIGLSSRPYTAFIQLANEQEFFDREKLSLHELPSPTETMQAFQVGKVDVAFLSIDQVVTLAKQSVDFKIISVIDSSKGGLALLTGADIDHLDKLVNKTIGLERMSSAAILFNELLIKHPVIFKTVKVVEIRQNRSLDLLKNNSIDAVIVDTPAKQHLLSAGAKELYNSKYMDQPILHFLVARTETIERNYQDLSHLLNGFYKAQAFFNSNKTTTYAALRQQLNVSLKELEAGLNEFKYFNQKQALVALSGSPSRIELELIKMNEYMLENKILVQPLEVDFAELIDTSLLKGIIND